MRNMRNFSHGNYFGSIITLVLETNRRVFVECLPVWYVHVAVSMENSTQVHRVDHDRPSILRNVLAAAVSSPPLLGRPFCKQVEKKEEIGNWSDYYLLFNTANWFYAHLFASDESNVIGLYVFVFRIVWSKWWLFRAKRISLSHLSIAALSPNLNNAATTDRHKHNRKTLNICHAHHMRASYTPHWW